MAKIPLIIDVDTGTDDALCILAALQHTEQLDIKAFTTVAGNVSLEKTSQNTLNILHYLKRPYPVCRGATQPLQRPFKKAISHGESGLGDVLLPKAEAAFSDLSVTEMIAQQAIAEKGALQLLAVGPLTNIALFLREKPEVRSLVKRITIMGGSLYGGNSTMSAEFNIYSDPEAAAEVFASGIPITMIGLNVTTVPIVDEHLPERLHQIPSLAADLAARIADFMLRRKELIGGDKAHFHDVIALAAIVAPHCLRFKPYYVEVETAGLVTDGMTVADFNEVSGKTANVLAAVEIDSAAFWAWFMETFERAV